MIHFFSSWYLYSLAFILFLFLFFYYAGESILHALAWWKHSHPSFLKRIFPENVERTRCGNLGRSLCYKHLTIEHDEKIHHITLLVPPGISLNHFHSLSVLLQTLQTFQQKHFRPCWISLQWSFDYEPSSSFLSDLYSQCFPYWHDFSSHVFTLILLKRSRCYWFQSWVHQYTIEDWLSLPKNKSCMSLYCLIQRLKQFQILLSGKGSCSGSLFKKQWNELFWTNDCPTPDECFNIRKTMQVAMIPIHVYPSM